MNIKLKRAAALLFALAAALSLAGCGEEERHDAQIFSMDTYMSLTAYGSEGDAGLLAAQRVINALDAMLDPERESSAVYNINASAGGSGAVATGQTVELLETSRTVYERSGGALDPTIYPIVKAWGFIDSQYRVPSESEIKSLMENVGYDRVSLSYTGGTDTALVTMPAGMELSFASVAKGCAAKYAVQAMRESGVESGIVTLGGNVQTLGTRPDGSDWNVGIQDPENSGAYAGIVTVGEAAVVTSGGYQRFFTGSDGRVYQHIIDPSTGYPSGGDLLSVTIICEDGTMADALSTALYVLGESGAVNYYRTYGGFEMVLVTDDGRVVVSDGLRDDFTLETERRVEYVRSEV